MRSLACSGWVAIALAVTAGALRDTQAQPTDITTAKIGIVNHTGNFIYSASVNDAGGANMSAWGVGGADVCCISLPRAWYSGMKVSVRWNMPVGVKSVIKEKIVEVEKYERPGSVYMHFFPDDEVRVIVSGVGPRSPDYPIPHSGNPNVTSSYN